MILTTSPFHFVNSVNFTNALSVITSLPYIIRVCKLVKLDIPLLVITTKLRAVKFVDSEFPLVVIKVFPYKLSEIRPGHNVRYSSLIKEYLPSYNPNLFNIFIPVFITGMKMLQITKLNVREIFPNIFVRNTISIQIDHTQIL